jgi:sec-independent protein translocase protein TatC
MKRKQRPKTAKRALSVQKAVRLPFIEHLLELRRRLFYVVVSVVVWSGAAYAIEHTLVNLLLEPAQGEKFIYTSVGGGLDFLMRVCIYAGIVLSIPVILYQILRYIEPLIGRGSTKFIFTVSAVSAVLAIAGVLFGYLVGLPAALNFLLNQFHTSDISALITIQSYLHFVIVYLVGSALMFQVPLIIYCINRIKPLRIKALLKYERWVIVVSIIAAAAINPSPRVKDLALLAVPMILSYQVGILLVWHSNRYGRRSSHVRNLLAQDAAVRQEREERLRTVEYVLDQSETTMTLVQQPAMPAPLSTATNTPGRSQKYVNDFTRPGQRHVF